MPLPPHTDYPTGDDLRLYAAQSGLAFSSAMDWGTAIEDAVGQWEVLTGWRPFLAKNTSVRYFDPPGNETASGRPGALSGGRHLDLKAGLLSLNELRIGVVPGGVGTLLVERLQFYLRPDNAWSRGLVVTEVEFLFPSTGLPQSITINGLWGRTLAIPTDVWNALLGYGFALAAPEIAIGISKGQMERKEGDVEVRYAGGRDSGPLSVERAALIEIFKKTAGRWRRVIL